MKGVVVIDTRESSDQLSLEPFAPIGLKPLTLKEAFKRCLDGAILGRFAAVNPRAVVVLVDFIPGRQGLGCYGHGLLLLALSWSYGCHPPPIARTSATVAARRRF